MNHPQARAEGSVAGLDAPALMEILEHLAHAVFVKDRELRFVFLNRAAEHLLGFPRDEMLGKTDLDFFPKAEADFFREKDLEMFQTGDSVEIASEPLTDAAGTVHHLSTTKTPLRNARGEVTHLVGVIHDITRLVEADEALRGVNEELERRVLARTAELEAAQRELARKQRISVLGKLAGGVAHQIRNPLGSISNAASILRVARPDSPEFRATLDVLREESAHANRIVTDLLNYARVRAPNRRRVLLSRTVEEVVAAVTMPPNVRVELSLPDEPAEAHIDELQVFEALCNLVRNAIEAMPTGGAVRITLTPRGREQCVTIRDEGDGIPAEVQASMFEPLLTTKPMGLGLGLVTAQALIVGQGGRLTWTTTAGEGTTFEVFVPAVPTVPPPAPPPE